MSLVTPAQAKDLLSLQGAISELGAELVVIGAIAYCAFIADSQRHTEDIDVALTLDLDDFDALESALAPRGWERDPTQEQRWRGPRKSRIDILPAGPKSRAAGQLVWPTSEMVMSLLGFDYVFQRAVEIEIVPGLPVKIVPPPLLFLLKTVAYLDDPHRRAKDLRDIHGLLKSYERDGDRTFSDEVFDAELPDVEFVPAFLLGNDLALFCRPAERAIIERFFEIVSDPGTQPFSSLLGYEGRLEPSEEHLLWRFRAFSMGFDLRATGARP